MWKYVHWAHYLEYTFNFALSQCLIVSIEVRIIKTSVYYDQSPTRARVILNAIDIQMCCFMHVN